jgi:antitoxin (DNA-binding transcriptional repressor) of toxin-antitoxin stability system
MKTVDITTLSLHLGDYLDLVRAGETVVIADREKPIAELRPSATGELERRPFGLCKGEFVVPDDFDAPLPEEILNDFYPQ